ncbi:MAG: ABC transporter permease [Candidatus Tectomicrobia bacterium]|uniref:ABC transporter permease n=1 Tax=Tectimicrobiota bacterium TaxID=2528274 RepID=A0A932I0B0_UNCTE|nr:ABC transporter permease [Candidatus Tectomicrobia bacterium]
MDAAGAAARIRTAVARPQLPAEVDWQVVLLAAALVGMGVFFSLRSPHFLTGENLGNVIRHAAILYIIAAGQTITILSAGIDLSQGMVASLVSVVAVDAIIHFGFAAGTSIGLLAGAAAGLFTGLMVAYVRIQPFLATVGMLYIAGGLALVYTSGRTLFFMDVTGKSVQAPVFFWLGQGHIGPVPVPLLVALGVAGLLYLLMSRTPFGRYVYAIGGNEEAAAMSGVPVQRVKMVIYMVSGLCVAVAAYLLSSRSASGHPHLGGFPLLMDGIASVAIGGTNFMGGEGGIYRTAMGVLIIAFLGNGLNILGVSTFVQQMIIGGIIIAAFWLSVARRRVA